MSEDANTVAVAVSALSHSYKDHQALKDLSFEVQKGEIFGLLGPNGSGKTTLFRILSTMLSASQGDGQVFGLSVAKQPAAVRALLGVVFQSPSLDKKLTVRENMKHQGHLYGLSGAALSTKIDALLEQVGLKDRAQDLVEVLSGGLQRRVEVAKSLLHDPKLLILDEPSTGLDPGARLDLWTQLRKLSQEQGITVLVTTHLMEEAERCDRLLILNEGQNVALGAPEELRREIGGEILTMQCRQPEALKEWLGSQHPDLELRVFEQSVRFETEQGFDLASRIRADFDGDIEAVSVGRPTLEDVFIRRTGHKFWSEI